MQAGGRLALYAAGLLVAFGGAFGAAAAAVPDNVVKAWTEPDEMSMHEDGGRATQQPTGHTPNGLSLESGGFVLSPVEAPESVGDKGELRFRILDRGGTPLSEFKTAHDKDLHLITVRADGTQFRHVHPELDAGTGTWSMPWVWQEPGTYRVYADFTPARHGASGITLTRAVEVDGGVFDPVRSAVQRTDRVDGYTVSLDGDMVAGSPGALTVSVERDGRPVSALRPYLGAFGHLVALREGDLAYVHVHAEGDAPRPGDTAGPRIAFMAEAPTAGRYLLYLDFRVDGKVHTAQFVLDASSGTEGGGAHDDSHSGDH